MMKMVYIPLIKVIAIGLISILSLSFLSCSADTGEDDTSSGPSASTAVYVIKGKVVNENDANKGIPGLQIEIISDKPHLNAETFYTSTDGSFNWEAALSTFGNNLSVKIIVTDTTNVFQSKETTVLFTKNEISEALSQFLGEIKKDVLIKLKKNN